MKKYHVKPILMSLALTTVLACNPKDSYGILPETKSIQYEQDFSFLHKPFYNKEDLKLLIENDGTYHCYFVLPTELEFSDNETYFLQKNAYVSLTTNKSYPYETYYYKNDKKNTYNTSTTLDTLKQFKGWLPDPTISYVLVDVNDKILPKQYQDRTVFLDAELEKIERKIMEERKEEQKEKAYHLEDLYVFEKEKDVLLVSLQEAISMEQNGNKTMYCYNLVNPYEGIKLTHSSKTPEIHSYTLPLHAEIPISWKDLENSSIDTYTSLKSYLPEEMQKEEYTQNELIKIQFYLQESKYQNAFQRILKKYSTK